MPLIPALPTHLPATLAPAVAPALPHVIGVLDLAGIAVFAISGALVAAQLRQTLVTMCFFAVITGVGGGSVRDLLIGAPVFWVHDPLVALVCLGVAVLCWITPHRWWQGAALEWADAIGLGAYAVLGTTKALAYGIPPVPAMIMGCITGCIGGVIRDVVAGRPSILMRPELYVTAAALASAMCAAGQALHLPKGWVWAVSAAAGFALRAAAIRFKLAIPPYGGDLAAADVERD
ncbi:trimeric intracellular cation channel family protein [Novosphingobium sp.]|uniref:trimeric intracellular cation channel family protein n=1 Tax=Novosphingobium sp. TaxID=1874826 RepID=UPI002FDDC624